MNGFDFKLTINKLDAVKPRQAGESEIDGQDVVWGWAVKFTTRNHKMVEDKEFGMKQIEVALEVEIPCDSKAETINVNEFLLKIMQDPKPFECDTELPAKSQNGYKAKSILKGTDFIKLFNRK